MADPLFWLALSFLLVVVSLTAVLVVAIPALRELGRAARSAEKFFDTLGRELPPTLEAIRLTGLEITELTDDVSEGVQGAGQVVQQVNQGLTSAQSKAKTLNTGTKSFLAGAGAAWRAWTKGPTPQQRQRTIPGSDPRRSQTSAKTSAQTSAKTSPRMPPATDRTPLPSDPFPAPLRRASPEKFADEFSDEASLSQAGIESPSGAEYAAAAQSETSPDPRDGRPQLPRGEEPFYAAAPDLALEETRRRADSAPAAERLAEPPPPQANRASSEPWE